MRQNKVDMKLIMTAQAQIVYQIKTKGKTKHIEVLLVTPAGTLLFVFGTSRVMSFFPV